MAEVNPLDKLVDYFKRNLEKGYDADSLKWALVKQGYSRAVIDRAIRHVNKKNEETKIENKKERPKIKYEIIGANNKPIKLPLTRRFFNLFKKK